MKYKKKCKNTNCGKEFMGTKTQQYCCPGCRVPTGYYKDKPKEKAPTQSKAKRKKVSSINEIARKARELGMSYGKYVEMLTIEEQRKQRERMKK
jgi:hypothetical protein